MEYGKIYDDCYSNCCDKLDSLAKDFFIENKNEGMIYRYSYKEFSEYLRNEFCDSTVFLKNEELIKLYSVFETRKDIYGFDFNEKIFINKIKPQFDKIEVEQLPKEYDFIKFIEEVAFEESKNEILTILSYHYYLFEKVYILERFDVFKIRVLGNLPIEENPYYKEFDVELYTQNKENINSKVEPIEVVKKVELPEKWYALLYWIELTANGQLPPRNSEGQFIKKEIEKIGNNRTGKSGQGFYRSFIEIDLNNTKLLNNHFGQNWKNEIIELSENNQKVTEYIQSKYNF